MHWIQQYILEQLLYQQYRRNRDLRPPRVESNLFQYHLNQLIKADFVRKSDAGYSLNHKGLVWADRYSSVLKGERPQPKIVSVIGLQDKQGRYLLMRRGRQPFVGQLHFPSGKIHQSEPLLVAAQREAKEKLGIESLSVRQIGWVHMTIKEDDMIITDYIGYLCSAVCPDGYVAPKGAEWINPTDESTPELMPGVSTILRSLMNADTFAEATIEVS